MPTVISCEGFALGASKNGRYGSPEPPLGIKQERAGISPGPVCSILPQKMEFVYFRFVFTVRSKDSLATKVAPHQSEPRPLGLIEVTLPAL